MMPDPWATYKCPSASHNQAVAIASSETNRIPADRGVVAQTRVFRGARLRSARRAPSTHSRGPNLTKEESQQRNRTEQEQRLCRKKEEAWELYQRRPTLTRKTRENFETKFRERVLGGIYSNSKDEQERDLQSWMNELEKVAQEEERRLEAFETKRMDKEDGQSSKPPSLGQDLPVSPETVPYVASHRRRRLVKEVYTSFDMYVHSSESPASIYSHTRCRSLPLCQSAELVSRCTGYKPNNVCISMERVSGHSVNAPSEPCILLRKGTIEVGNTV